MKYDLDDRLIEWNGETIASDDDGNMLTIPISEGVEPATFDARNRLVSVGGTSYEYDAEGRRTAVSNATGRTRLITNPHARLSQLLVTVPDAGQPTYFIYGAGGLMYKLQAGTPKYYSFDPRGNVVARLHEAGGTISSFVYSPFAQAESFPAESGDIFMFGGRYGVQTDASGLLYVRARYYSPYSRRFLSADPLVGLFVDSGSLNPFTYANNSPLVFIDPLGLYGVAFHKELANDLNDANALLTAAGLAMTLFPATLPVGLAVLATTSISGFGISAYESLATGDPSPVVWAGVGTILGQRIGQRALKGAAELTGIREKGLGRQARFYTANGRYIRTLTGQQLYNRVEETFGNLADATVTWARIGVEWHDSDSGTCR